MSPFEKIRPLFLLKVDNCHSDCQDGPRLVSKLMCCYGNHPLIAYHTHREGLQLKKECEDVFYLVFLTSFSLKLS